MKIERWLLLFSALFTVALLVHGAAHVSKSADKAILSGFALLLVIATIAVFRLLDIIDRILARQKGRR